MGQTELELFGFKIFESGQNDAEITEKILPAASWKVLDFRWAASKNMSLWIMFTWDLCGEQAATAVQLYPGQRAGSLPDRVSPCPAASLGREGHSWNSWRTSRGRSGPPESPVLREVNSGSYHPGEESAGWIQQEKGVKFRVMIYLDIHFHPCFNNIHETRNKGKEKHLPSLKLKL